MASAFWLYYQLRKASTFTIASLGLIFYWISYEFLHQSWDLAFPWMTLGNGFASNHQLIQWYEYTGVYGGTLWILLSNILLFTIIRHAKDQTKKHLVLKPVFLWIALIIIPITISLLQYYTYEEEVSPADVVVVQPNVDPYAKYGTESVESQLEHLIQLSDSAGKINTEFFIWPETAIPERTDEKNIWQTTNFRRIDRKSTRLNSSH